jgi:hypothetical protein
MIRPFTFVTLMLACTSGAYLFVVKHRATGLDTEISSVTGQIRAAEQRIRVLRAEWALENDPSKLAALSKQFLKLKPMEPRQLTTIQNLADILPPPGAGIPRLPLPPPPSWAITPAPSGANAPIASAAPAWAVPVQAAPAPAVALTAFTAPPLSAPKPMPAVAPVRLAAAQPGRLAANPVHHPVTLKKQAVPVQHPPSLGRSAARHVIHDARQHPRAEYQYSSSPPMGGHVVAVTAKPAPVRMAPRFTTARPYQAPPAPAQSVFGNLGADLPPPRPVFRSPQ